MKRPKSEYCVINLKVKESVKKRENVIMSVCIELYSKTVMIFLLNTFVYKK